MLVDAHTHLLPDRLQAKVRAFFGAHDELGLDLAYGPGAAEVIERHTADGFDAMWHLPYAHKPGVGAGLNEASATTAASFAAGAVTVVPGCTVHVADEGPDGIVLDAVDRLGCRVLKLHCSVGDHEVDDARLERVWAAVAERRLPVVVHLGHAVSGHTEAHEVAPLERVAARHPEARIVVAHCGHRAVAAVLALTGRHEHVFADITPVVTELAGVTAGAAATAWPKLLLGTDAPNTAIPAADVVEQVRSWALPRYAEAAVLGETAAALVTAVHA